MSRLKAVVVVVLLVGAAGAGALFGLNMFYQERMHEHMTARLAGAEQDLVAHFRIDAFEAIQRLWTIRDNEGLHNALAKLPASTADMDGEALSKALEPARELLKPLMDELKKRAETDELLVLSPEGQVLAKTSGPASPGESMKGLPAFQDCMAGVARDGFYELAGKVKRVAVVPLQSSRGKTGGCLFSATGFGEAQIQKWSSRTGLDAALFLRKKVMASTLEADRLAPLVDNLGTSETVVFGPAPGPVPLLADLEGKGYAARSTKVPTGTDELYAAVVLPATNMLPAWKEAQNLVLMGTGALFVFGLLLGLLLSGKGKDRQLEQLANDVEMLSSGNMTSIDPEKYSGVHEQLAVGIQQMSSSRPATAGFNANASVSAILGGPTEPEPASAPGSDGSELDFESLLQPGSGQQPEASEPAAPASDASELFTSEAAGTSQPEPAPPPAVPAVPPAPEPPTPEPPAPQPPQAAEPEPSEAIPAPPPATAPPPTESQSGPRVELPGELAGIFDEAEETREVEPLIPPQARPDKVAQAPRPHSPPPPPSAPPPTAPPPIDQGEDEDIRSSDYRPDATVIAQVPDELLKAAKSSETGGMPGGEAALRTQLPKPPVVPPPPEPSGRQPSEEAHFKEVFDKFVQTKKQCGESTAGLTLERFSEKLKKNTSDLKARYKCRSVKFQVYVKNGKAALKATPIK